MAEQVSSLKTGIKYIDTPIGKVPVDWKSGTFSEVAEINPKRNLRNGTIYPFVEMAAITSQSHRVQYTKLREFNGGGSKFQNGDTLFARITPCTENGKTAYVDFLNEDQFGHGSTEFIILGPKKGVDGKFIYYVAKWDKVRNIAVSKMEGTSGRQRVPSKVFIEDIFVPIPPFFEQRKIADILTMVDEAIEKTAQVIEKTKETKKGLMQKLFTRGIGHKKFKKTEIGEIPEEWEMGTFSKIADINPKRNLKRGIIYPFVEMAAIDSQSHRVQFSRPRKYEGGGTKFQNGDTLFARITPCTENGKTAYVDFLKEIKFGHGSTEFIILGPKEDIDSKFIYYCAKWDKVRSIAISKMEGTSGRQRVPIRVFSENIFIPIPPYSEQKQIAEILSSVDDEIEKETNHKEQLESLKKGLMQVLLTGKIRVS